MYNEGMASELPELNSARLTPTRDHLQDAALAIGSLSRAFLPKHPRDWHYGLEVTMRGIGTPPFTVGGQEYRAIIDLVRNTVRLDGQSWRLDEYSGPELFKNFKVW